MNVAVKIETESDWLRTTLDRAEAKVIATARRLGGAHLHAATQNGRYGFDRAEWWTSGFWPGMLWLVHQGRGETHLRDLATISEHGIFGAFSDPRMYEFHHDVGFQFLPTSVLRYRLTGDAEARRRGVAAANFLMSRYNPASGVLEAWNSPARFGLSIIDTLINLPLLFWAAEEENQPRYAQVARTHLAAVLKHWLREDGTTYHVLKFDPRSGTLIEPLGGQGYAPGSTWSRGLSWAVLGLPLAYRHARDEIFLDKARLVADAFLARLPDHQVPPWDFAAPEPGNAPRDSSAGAIAACGLLELAALTSGTEAVRWRASALRLLRGLSTEVSLLDRFDVDGLLAKGTGKKPLEENVEVSLIYGDYYFLEALYRLQGGVVLPW